MASSEMHVRGALTVDYSSVAATIFLLWDILLTIGDESVYIWPKPHTYWAKWLFLFVRYFALALQISLLFVGTRIAADFGYTHSACVIWYIYQEVAVSLLIFSVEFILVIRVKALYHRNNVLIWILYFLFLVEVVAMSVSLSKAVPLVGFDSACVVTHSPLELIYFAAAYIAFEALLFILTAYKLVSTLYHGWGSTPVLNVIVRDGTWAFAMIFATLVCNAVFYLAAGDSSMAAVAYSWIISVESFAGYRIILNMQKLEPHDISTLDSPSLSTDIQFTTNIELDHTTGSIEEAAPYPYRSTANEPDITPQSFMSLGQRGVWTGKAKASRGTRGGGVRSRLEMLRRGRLSFSPTVDFSANEEFELSATSETGSTSGFGSSSREGRDWSKPSTSYA
ncbi:hypothetical protein PENSPDRAFT_478821 [Peniophora sp. CONT]|nr:hypothetical protein PENSPDRAFT_478821 [Peniophora sp. CONT]